MIRRDDWRMRIFLHAVLVIATLLTLLPLFWMLGAALSPQSAAETAGWRLFPANPTLDNFRDLTGRLQIWRYALNSAGLALAVTGLSLVFNSAAGYAFAKLRFAGRERLFSALLAALLIPGQVAMLPLFLLLKQLGMVNSYLGIIVPGLASVFGVFLMRQYALSIPDSLLDAARIDGAGETRIFLTLVLPLCRPMLATLAVFTFIGSWNDFMWPLIVLTDDSLHTLPIALANLLGEHGDQTELMMAGAMIALLPVLVLFLAMQRHYLAGLTAGGVKG